MRKLFRLPDVPAFTLVRIDSDAATDSPADIRTIEGLREIPGSQIRADSLGDMPDVYGPDGADTIFMKAVSANVELDATQTHVADTTSSTPGTLSGAILGAVLVNLAKTWLTSALPSVWLFAMGGLFIAVTLFLPQGIIGLVTSRPVKPVPEPTAVPAPGGEAAAREVAG